MGRWANFSKVSLGGGTKSVEGIEEIQVHAEGEIEIVCPLRGIDEFQGSISLLSDILVWTINFV